LIKALEDDFKKEVEKIIIEKYPEFGEKVKNFRAEEAAIDEQFNENPEFAERLKKLKREELRIEKLGLEQEIIKDPYFAKKIAAKRKSIYSELERFNNLIQTEVNLDEFEEILNPANNQEPEDSIQSYIQLNIPSDMDGFLFALQQAKTFHRGELAGVVRQSKFTEERESIIFDDHRIYREYWLNNVSSFDDVVNGIDWIWQQEKARNIVKMTYSFGIITEVANQDGEVEYKIHNSSEREGLYNPPVFVNEKLLPELKYHVLKGINNLHTDGERSNNRKVAIFNVNICVYNMFKTGATDPIIHHLIKNGSVFSYEGEYNICWFAIGVFEEYFQNNQGRLLMKTIESKTKSEWYNFLRLDEEFANNYEEDLSPKTDKYRKLLKEYKGFQLHDIMKYLQWKNYNIRVYMCDPETKSYKLSEEYNHPEPNENTKTINIALVFLPDGRVHTLYIKNIDKATGVVLCPKCKYKVFNISPNNTNHQGTNSAYSLHLKNCDGKIHREQKLVIRSNNLPYAPHILQNKTYKYLFSRERLNEFKPRRYYITFDFETMEERTEIKVGSSSKILAKLKPLAVSGTIKTKSGIEIVYKDERDGKDFIKQWLEIIFEKAKQIKIDNSYNDKNIPFDNYVPIIGFNSGRFDLNFLLEHLSNPPAWNIKKCMGSTNFKTICVTSKDVELKFIDLMNFVSAPSSLDSTVKDFTDKVLKKSEMKGCLAYEAIEVNTFREFLNETFAFQINEFDSRLKMKKMTMKEYVNFLIDWFNLKNGGVIKNRWDYLKYYCIKDTTIMINPIDYLIEQNFKDKVDMLQYLTLASDSSVLKYCYAYKDFDVKMVFKSKNRTFEITKEWLSGRCRGYNEQDKKANRPYKNNISVNDLIKVNKILKDQKYCCSICGSLLNTTNLTFDRIDCDNPHTIDNITMACYDCNISRSNRDYYVVRLETKLRRFADRKGLPYVPDNEKVIRLLQEGITGGLSNVHHRKNIAGETHVNRLYYDIVNKKVISKDLEWIITHIVSFDFNSLYPSDYSSIYSEKFPYTGHRMYMPGKIIRYYKTEPDGFATLSLDVRKEIMNIINSRDTLFIAKVKAHIPEERYNEFISFPPIIRNIDIPTEDGKTERKLTQLFSTMDGYMCFTNYYLWLLIDYFGLVIDDVEELTTFTKHRGFEKFVTHFMDERIEARKNGNKGKDKYAKMVLNAAFGKDGLNTKNYNKTEILSMNEALFKQSDVRFLSSRQITDNLYAVSMAPSNYCVSTPLQCAVWTLDNAKVWYLLFLYGFIYKAFDMDRFHYIEGDTDSMYFGVSGDPNDSYKQGFNNIIKDQKFYDENVYKWLPDPAKGIEDEKKLLGVCVEKEGTEMIAIAPKCYYINTYNEPKRNEAYEMVHKPVLKIKGVSLSRNNIKPKDYIDVVNESKIIKGQNCNFLMKRLNGQYTMIKLETDKNAITPVHNKMICLPNFSCAPFIKGLTKEDYICE
jgi:hypothetical protein